jgi:ABC-type glycerol-3-phosphate transport system permease component
MTTNRVLTQAPATAAVRPSRRSFGGGNQIYYVVLLAWAVVTVFIFVWLLLSSLKTNVEVFGSPWALPATPLEAASANFGKAWNLSKMGSYLGNSIVVTSLSVLLVVAVSAPASYALTRMRFFGNTFLSYYFIAGMGLPLQLMLIPLFVLLSQVKLANSLQGLILVYVAVSIPFTTLLLTGFFRTLPSELEDAAAIDGCSEFGTFWRVMMPLASPGLMTAAILNFVSIWNEFLLALLIIKRDTLRTMPLGIYGLRYSMQYTADWSALFAGVVIIVIPNLLFYLIFSDRITSGLTLGSGK